ATTRPADATAEAELPLIDRCVVSDWSGDMDKDDVVAILARVPDEGHRSIVELQKAIAAGDLPLARRTAHRLKGMANNLGAVRLAQLARAIEISCQRIEDVSARMSALQRTLGETLEALSSYR